MKTLTLLLALFVSMVLPAAAADPSALRKSVDEWVTKSRPVGANPFGAPEQYSIAALVTAPATDKARRASETLLLNKALVLAGELDALAKQANATPADKALIGQLAKARAALLATKADKAKAADALRELSALR